MLSFFLQAKQFFAQVFELGWWLVLGGGIAFLAALFRSWLGYAGVAVGGAAIMFIAITGGWLADDSDRVKRLEQELKWEQAKRAEIEATNKVLYESLVEESQAAESNAEVMARLQDQLEEMQDRPECTTPEGFTDELKKLR